MTGLESTDLKINDIVQAISTDWAPALIVVTEIKDWGIMGYTSIPTQGDAYIRLKWDEIELTGGHAVMVRDVQ